MTSRARPEDFARPVSKDETISRLRAENLTLRIQNETMAEALTMRPAQLVRIGKLIDRLTVLLMEEFTNAPEVEHETFST
ncbi:MAG TPA: hypothetical protein PKH39_16320 [Woeseiaceae bacterium]|nr:hypothetical protein [Woeseiaceae bacterium]